MENNVLDAGVSFYGYKYRSAKRYTKLLDGGWAISERGTFFDLNNLRVDIEQAPQVLKDFVDNFLKKSRDKGHELFSARFAIGCDRDLDVMIVRRATEAECVEIEKEYEENIKAEKRVEEIAKSSLTVNLSKKEVQVLDDLSSKTDLPKESVMKKALALYQSVAEGIVRVEPTEPPVGLPKVE